MNLCLKFEQSTAASVYTQWLVSFFFGGGNSLFTARFVSVSSLIDSGVSARLDSSPGFAFPFFGSRSELCTIDRRPRRESRRLATHVSHSGSKRVPHRTFCMDLKNARKERRRRHLSTNCNFTEEETLRKGIEFDLLPT
eukprot:Gregarina_sp_Poly_1__6654@NODE_357_length_9264_cov_154_100902_g180_i2_p6_GENE_NODE_357_length_9264_cov_154_100902_g180_i2NODE_357_length_9264_cov_154_100902_g180_i2_p6_ORF_typecomplete_len139_score18_55_NODE_357_length_9264_cov_154_100902_g180_i216462062